MRRRASRMPSNIRTRTGTRLRGSSISLLKPSNITSSSCSFVLCPRFVSRKSSVTRHGYLSATRVSSSSASFVQCIAFFRCPRPVLGRRALLQACRGELGKTQLFLCSLRDGHGCIQACLCTLRFLAAVHFAFFFVLDGSLRCKPRLLRRIWRQVDGRLLLRFLARGAEWFPFSTECLASNSVRTPRRNQPRDPRTPSSATCC